MAGGVDQIIIEGIFRDRISKPAARARKSVQQFGQIGAILPQAVKKFTDLNHELRSLGGTIYTTTPKIAKQQKAFQDLNRPLTMTGAIARTTFTNINREVRNMGNTTANILPKMQQRYQELSTVGWGWNKVMGMSMETMQQVRIRGYQKNFTMMGKLGYRVRAMTHGFRRFRMEMLGVMFFGMSLQRIFGGLLQPALKMSGLMDLLSTTLAIVFLPIALTLLDILLPIFEWFMNLSDAVKKAIGWFAILGFILGGALFFIGQFALGIGSVILAFSGLFIILDKLIPDISILGFNISSVLEAGMAIIGLGILWRAFKDIIGSVIGKFLELDFVRGLLSKLGLEVDESKSVWGNFKDFIKTIINKIQDKIKELTGKDGALSWIAEVIEDVKKKGTEWLEEFKNEMDEVGLSGIKEDFKNMGKAIEGITPSVKTLTGLLVDMATALTTIREMWRVFTTPIREVGEWMGRQHAKLLKETKIPLPIEEPIKLQKGGIISSEGLYHLHAGETVVPANQSINPIFNPIINITATSNVDIDTLKSQLSSEWNEEINRLIRR